MCSSMERESVGMAWSLLIQHKILGHHRHLLTVRTLEPLGLTCIHSLYRECHENNVGRKSGTPTAVINQGPHGCTWNAWATVCWLAVVIALATQGVSQQKLLKINCSSQSAHIWLVGELEFCIKTIFSACVHNPPHNTTFLPFFSCSSFYFFLTYFFS